MARMLLLVYSRLEAFLDGFKAGTRAADYTPLVSLVWEVVLCLLSR